ncbi:gp31 [Listeria phage B025]|uniref:Gp31 n=1 Tax=Listeria phage B025 TaxID=330396 RepID=A8ATC4_9CAUD|nr:gp31 [Listeria phage B025]AAY53071.1 gp31 [Listeria phage B025]
MSLFLSFLRNVTSATARVIISRTVFISSKTSFTISTPFYIHIIIHVLYKVKHYF